jgi:murein DD-endopeptidase MepM/ murein hydrolase activator NlpD
MSNNKKGGIYGKGYYIALILCATAIGISGYVYYRNANKTEAQLQQPPADAAVAEQEQADVPVVVTQPAQPVDGGEEEELQPVIAPTEVLTVLQTCSPVEGQTVSAYAMDCLSYNQTTRDWRVHNGVDIAAEEGAVVCAAADGVVYTTYTDDSMGTTVVIRHEGGYTTHYSSLAEDLQVSAGDTVKMGQAIGCVGSTALIETAIGPHVHFSVTYRDAQIDPAEFFALGK